MDDSAEYVSVSLSGTSFGPNSNGHYWGSNSVPSGGAHHGASHCNLNVDSEALVFPDYPVSADRYSDGNLRLRVYGPSDIAANCNGYGAVSGSATLKGCLFSGVQKGTC